MSDLPLGWIETSIENVFAVLSDGRTLHQGWSPQCEKEPSKSEDRWGVLKTTAIQDGFFLPEQNKRLPNDLDPRPLIEVHEGDILITCAGPRARCGISCLVPKTRPRLMMSGKMYRFRVPEPHADPRYVSFYLRTTAARFAIDRMKTGISDSGLNLTHDRFRQLKIPIAPHEEQMRIVAAIEEQFSRLDSGAAALERVKHNLKRMRAAMLQAATTARVGADVPKVRLGDVLREPLRNGHSSKANPSGTIPIITLTAVTLGDFGSHNIKMTAADPKRVHNLWIQPGDLLIERSNTQELVGTACLYRGHPDLAVYPDLIIRARVNEKVLPEYVELVLKAPSSRQYFQQKAQGISGTMPKIDQQTIQDLIFRLPSLEMQATIVEQAERELTVVDSLEATLELVVKRNSGLRSSILAAAFSGKLVPQDTNDEPASILLERIANEQASSNGRRSARARDHQVLDKGMA